MKYIKLSKKFWDESYMNGYANVMSAEKELVRYKKIVELIESTGEIKRVLDLGCGNGLLENMVSNQHQYVGVDISSCAIKIADANKKHFHSIFVCDDICTYNPLSEFDVIIFNESLYYIENARKVVERYFNYLQKCGSMVISIYVPNEQHRSYRVFDELCRSVLLWGYDISKDENISGGDCRWRLICLKK